MVAWYENDPCSLAGGSQQLLQNVVVGLRPVNTAANFPQVYDVSDQVNGVGRVVLDEMQQGFGLCGLCSEMDVRNEEGPVMLRTDWVQIHR